MDSKRHIAHKNKLAAVVKLLPAPAAYKLLAAGQKQAGRKAGNSTAYSSYER